MVNEKRLIDANALNWRASHKRRVELFPNWKELPQEVKDMLCKHGKEFERLLKEAPTVDAVEVVHGRWEDEYGGEFANPRYRCSVCKGKSLYRFDQDCLGGWHEIQALTGYCPNCGAKMDGGNEDV